MGCFGVPRLRKDWSVHLPKSRVLVSFAGVLSKGLTKMTTYSLKSFPLRNGAMAPPLISGRSPSLLDYIEYGGSNALPVSRPRS